MTIHPVLSVTYLDHSMSWDADDYDERKPFIPVVCTVVGYQLGRDDPAWYHVAAEREGDGFRAVTHVLKSAVVPGGVRSLVSELPKGKYA